jgi:hypothetical protein
VSVSESLYYDDTGMYIRNFANKILETSAPTYVEGYGLDRRTLAFWRSLRSSPSPDDER